METLIEDVVKAAIIISGGAALLWGGVGVYEFITDTTASLVNLPGYLFLHGGGSSKIHSATDTGTGLNVYKIDADFPVY
jgi:hypothetical protein